MVSVCDYSSLIFAGNLTVLMILSLTTDYWEYRTFDRDKILKHMKTIHSVKVVVPRDTESYIQLWTEEVEMALLTDAHVPEQLLYHPPLFVRTVFATVRNASSSEAWLFQIRHEITLFLQHGNLFRDCDELEVDVRKRLKIHHTRPSRCVYFETNPWLAFKDAETLKHLDVSASLFAVLCTASIIFSSISGGYGLFSNYLYLKAYTIASRLSLIAGFFLTLSIALFHGKCYTLRKVSLLPGYDIPFKDILEMARVYSYGWSFSLAWICVFFCYISSFVWLHKAQGPRRFVIHQPKCQPMKNLGRRISLFGSTKSRSIKDIATV